MTIMQAINRARWTLEYPKVDARDGLTHRLQRYDRRAALWRFACDVAFLEDATRQPASELAITCVACMGLEGRVAFVPPP